MKARQACSNVRLWKLNTQKKIEETRLDAFEMKDSAGFVDSQENKLVGS